MKVDNLLRDADCLQKYVEVVMAEIEVLKIHPQRLDISLLMIIPSYTLTPDYQIKCSVFSSSGCSQLYH